MLTKNMFYLRSYSQYDFYSNITWAPNQPVMRTSEGHFLTFLTFSLNEEDCGSPLSFMAFSGL